jgi:hypothetical protein
MSQFSMFLMQQPDRLTEKSMASACEIDSSKVGCNFSLLYQEISHCALLKTTTGVAARVN